VAECLIPVAAGEPPQIRMALAVTRDYFRVLGVSARFGRTFTDEDTMAVVLAHGSAIDIGKTRRIGTKLYTVIGVAPENFGLDRFLHQDFYIPIRSYGDGKILEDRSRRFLTVHVRGANAGPKIAAIATRLEAEYPKTNRGRLAVVLDEMTARRRTDKIMTPLAELLATLAALLLAIGCANACGALLMRGEARAREVALKMALGAGPIRLLGESLSESGRIAAAGCALALPLAWIVTEALRRSIVLPTDFAISVDARVDGRVAAIALMAAALATLICGVIPSSLIAWRMDVWGALKSRERSSKSRGRNLIAMVEIALAAALAATGGSLWAGLAAAKNADLGYWTNGISVMTFDPGQSGYDESRTRGFYRDLLEQVKSLPGVRGAALAQSVPLGMTGAQKQVRIGDTEEMTVWMNIVTPEYFDLMHIGVVAGRAFGDRDRAVVILNEELAKRIGVGEQMRVGGRMMEVIGVVKTAKYMRWDEAPRPFFYLPYAQNYAPRMTLHVESTTPVFDHVRRIAGPIPMSDARLLREYFDNGAMFGVKAALKIASVAGIGGLLLALAGLYSVVSSAVERRSREIGIRIAVGARHGAVFAMIVREGMVIAAIGTALGLGAGLSGTRLLQGFVPGAWSWWAGALAAGLMIGASAIACVIPAIRALRVDPATVLRET
jgi:predicted permease